MAYKRSVFPENGYDVFQELYDLPPSYEPLVEEFANLRFITNRTPEQEERFNQLSITLQDYFLTAERWNKFQDALTGVQKFFLENTQGYIDGLKQEMQVFVDGKQAYIIEFVDGKVRLINNTVSEGINTMEDKKDYFVTFVNTKVDEVRNIVQEFDSNSARYYTTWIATQGQIDFNIFQGSNKNLPPEANLNIATENIDLIINGVLQTPYTDFMVHNNGLYDTIRLAPSAQSLIQEGTEVVAKWYKNVGKLYFKHADSHGAGGRDALTVTEGMLDTPLANELTYIPTKSAIAPDTKKHKLWIKTVSV